jgi:23S rRNA (guanosine2251-2'-O)-methyltransferase
MKRGDGGDGRRPKGPRATGNKRRGGRDAGGYGANHKSGSKRPTGSRRGKPGPRPGDDLVKGRHAVEALLRNDPTRVLALFHWGPKREHDDLVALAVQASIAVRAGAPDDYLANDNLAQGLAVRVKPYAYADLDQIAPADAADRVLLVLDSITDPRNLGAILRSAAFFGVDGVVLPRDRACQVGPAVERISRGATTIVPIARVTNIARTIATLRDRGYLTVATVLAADAVSLNTLDMTLPIALVLGGEGRGVRRLVAERCDVRTILPGQGVMQSLNVASFATLALAACRGFRRTDSA